MTMVMVFMLMDGTDTNSRDMSLHHSIQGAMTKNGGCEQFMITTTMMWGVTLYTVSTLIMTTTGQTMDMRTGSHSIR